MTSERQANKGWVRAGGTTPETPPTARASEDDERYCDCGEPLLEGETQCPDCAPAPSHQDQEDLTFIVRELVRQVEILSDRVTRLERPS